MILPWQALTCLSAWAWRTLIRPSYLLRHSSSSPAGFSNVYMKTGLKTGGFCLQSRHDSSEFFSSKLSEYESMSLEVVFFAVFLSFFSGHTLMRFWASLLPPQIGCIFWMKSMKVSQDLVLFSMFSVVKKSRKPWNWVTIPSKAGFYYQITHGFALEFPYSLIMLPCTIVEWVIRWHIYTWAAARSCENWTTERFATPVAPLSGPTHKVFHDNFASFFCVPFGPRKSLRWQWYWK